MSETQKMKWLGKIDGRSCDTCSAPLDDFDTFYDVAVPAAGGRWGLLCESCFEDYSCRLGTGFGQEYSVATKEKLRG